MPSGIYKEKKTAQYQSYYSLLSTTVTQKYLLQTKLIKAFKHAFYFTNKL